MKLVLVYGPMAMGGIETLLVRLVPELKKAGHEVRLLCQEGPLLGEIDARESISTYSDWGSAAAIVDSINDASVDTAFVSLDPTSCALASWLRPRIAGALHVTGVYHPRAWFFENDPLRLTINRILLATLADEQVVFMNDECRQSHATWAKRSFAGSSIVPLAVKIHEAATPRPSEAFRVVSVGRLAAFKDYNLYAPKIARSLSNDASRVTWEIFGGGEIETAIQNAIISSGMSDAVHLRGQLPYRDFSSIGERYDAFVGMGTAALEAATLGLPTIVAVCDGGESSYGFVQDLPFGNVGEMQAQSPTRTISELLSKVKNASAEERRAIGLKSRAAASLYSMKAYAAALVDAIQASRRSGQRKSWIAAIFYYEASIGTTRKLLGRIWRMVRR